MLTVVFRVAWKRMPWKTLQLSQKIDPPHGVERYEVNTFFDSEPSRKKFRLCGCAMQDKPILIITLPTRCPASSLLACAPPGFVVAIHPQRKDDSLTGNAVKLSEHRHTVFCLTNVVEQAHAENGINRIVGQRNIEC